ncbi:hypothetical protein GOQ29_12935 [Clostridium sp. D2Q-14]|uniref:ATP-grasp domain-containing protein n=1 Tax=Anaeromonas gelatinilytica TaxID=2683194 RepID=UPI00193AF335|nr:hypothetical protein [Anaeromonas gelatinilytica]MBS4536524.1 hypothetical protein [Anaeromonas gelatinilytica]
MIDVAILVSEKYCKQSNPDDIALKKALMMLGHTSQIVAWDDESIDFSAFKIAIIRSCWDYDQRLDEFLKRMNFIESKCLLLNPYRTIKENSNKFYLKDLQKRGVSVVPTIFINSESDFHKQSINFDSQQVIIKPVVSASGRDTYRYKSDDFKGIQETIKKIVESKSVMIQPYIESIETSGERSTVVIEGVPVFTMQKKPAEGGFLVHKHWGGTYNEITATEKDLLFLQKVYDVLEEKPLYMRVDYVYDNNNKPLLLELELIEPNLYLQRNDRGLKILSEKLSTILKKEFK